MSPFPYISRQSAENLETAFAKALENPATNPIVFHVWGIGGVGKTTLTGKLKENYSKKADFVEISFGMTPDVDNPLKIMDKFYNQLPDIPFWNRDLLKSDPFLSLYQQYKDTVNKLETEPVEGKQSVDKEQIELFKSLFSRGASALAQLAPASGITAPIAEKTTGLTFESASILLTEKDRIVNLLSQHRATKNKRDLQELMLNPLPKLTKAFVESLKSRIKPVILVFDTYEKGLLDIDAWLWQYLLVDNDLQSLPIRLIVAGRDNILEKESWRKLQQDKNLVREEKLECFDENQTKEYLERIDNKKYEETETICQITKGLPYYLNWIRKQTKELDFSQANREIVNLLLQGLNENQIIFVKIAACCHWFDKNLVQYLCNKKELDFGNLVDDRQNCFEWLKQRDFVEYVDGKYRLDDVARDIFQEDFWREDENEFREIHGILAEYFQEKANREVSADSSPPEMYNNSTWRGYIAESLCHQLFLTTKEVEEQFIAYLFTSRYFRQDEIVQIPFASIVSEYKLLKEAKQKILANLYPAIIWGWNIFEEESIEYEGFQDVDISESQVQKTLKECFRYLNSLTGIAKFVALLYKSKRCPENEREKYLSQAKEQAELIVAEADSEFSSNLFLWDIGNSFSELKLYEEAISSYDKAVEIKPDNHEAWDNKGLSLAYLGRFEEAITSYNLALAIQPDYPNAWYNKACAYALQGQINLAVENLEKAISLDEEYRDMAKNDADFDRIREDSRFQKLI
jgi:tetratricopeptide (TPR) repeat protein